MKISRRSFLKKGGAATAGLLLSPYLKMTDGLAWAITPYPAKKLGNVRTLKAGSPIATSYPDVNSPVTLLRLNESALGGVGPNSTIVAFSSLCTHKGCPVAYVQSDETLVCPCHQSKFDPAKAGQIVIAQATENLPQVELRIDAKGDIIATGVKKLLYGRFENQLYKKQVSGGVR